MTFLYFFCLVVETDEDEDEFSAKRRKGICLLFSLSKETKLLELLIKLISFNCLFVSHFLSNCDLEGCYIQKLEFFNLL